MGNITEDGPRVNFSDLKYLKGDGTLKDPENSFIGHGEHYAALVNRTKVEAAELVGKSAVLGKDWHPTGLLR